ncbi:MAG: hypothetical protein B6242_05815 [Anaerolineaceae bacterium 4572_78]|nr:MAG: hypothetical protein B6242_05815 [Anaerolineaceae bacterium 4572_78]
MEERQTGLRDYIETGVKLDAFVTKFLLTTIFYDKTDLHDGAVIIQHNRIIAAGCLLPLSHTDVKENLGTRHRAGIGLTESTDAIVVIVSEENGIISVAHNGQITRRLDQSKLIKMLRTFYYHELKKPTTFFAQAKGKLGEMFHM